MSKAFSPKSQKGIKKQRVQLLSLFKNFSTNLVMPIIAAVVSGIILAMVLNEPSHDYLSRNDYSEDIDVETSEHYLNGTTVYESTEIVDAENQLDENVINVFIVTLYQNEGHGDKTSFVHENGAPLPEYISTPNRNNYEFIGYIDYEGVLIFQSDGVRAFGDPWLIDENITLVAQWRSITASDAPIQHRPVVPSPSREIVLPSPSRNIWENILTLPPAP